MVLKKSLPDLLIFLIACVSITSCSKREWATSVEKMQLPFTGVGKYYDVHVDRSGTIHIVGGDRFNRNDFLQSDDKGATWQVSHFNAVEYSNKAAFAIAEHEGAMYASSFDGKIFKNLTARPGAWELGLGQVWWYALTGMDFNKGGIGLAAGNNGITTGVMLRFSKELDLLQNDTFPYALNDVAFVDENVAYAVGYGALLRTKDAGLSWQQLDLTDDNYRSVFVVDKDNIWTVGFNGTIAHVTNEGASYNKVKNGQNPFSDFDRYIDIAFKGQHGFIVGEKGVVLQTRDGGKSWDKMKKFTKSDLRAVCFDPFVNAVYFVGDDGAAFKYVP